MQQNPRIKEPKEPKELPVEKTFTLTQEDLNTIIKSAVQGAMSAQPSAPAPVDDKSKVDLAMTLTQQINKRLAEGQQFNRQLYESSDFKTIIIDEIYQEYIGQFFTVTINGNTVKVPVDGNPYKVTPSHYAAIRERLNHVSKQRSRSSRVVPLFGDSAGDFSKI